MPPNEALIRNQNDDEDTARNTTLNGYSTIGDAEQGVSLVSPRVLRRRSFIEQFSESGGPLPIVFVVLLLAMAFGATVGIIPPIMTQRFAELRYGYNGDDCRTFDNYENKPQECLDGSADSQNAAAVSELVANTMTLITSSLIGSISDVRGRRGMFLAGALCASLGPVALLYVQTTPTANPLIYYWARAMHGLVNWMAIALTAVADILPPHLRAPGVGLVMAGFWGGLCLAPMIAIFTDHLHVIYIACGLQLAGLVITFCFFPETLPDHAAEQARRRVEATHIGDNFQSRLIWSITRPMRELSILNRNGFFRLLSSLAFFNGMVTAGDKTLLLYYVDSKLSFTAMDIAVMFLLVGFTAVTTQVLILKPLNDCIGERMIVIVCFFTSIISNTTYGIAWNKQTLYAGICLGGLAQMAFPTISAIKANNVDHSEQGRIQGALYSIQAIAAGVGPMMMRLVDSLAKDTILGPGAMFIFNAIVQSYAFYCSCQLPKDKSNSRNLRNSSVEAAEMTEPQSD